MQWLTDLDRSIQMAAGALGTPGEAILRMAVALLFGGLVGIEREVRGRQAGFRTNLLVCLGSCVVMLVSTQLAQHRWDADAGGSANFTVDPARIAYGVMTGIGFLGAGTIMQERGSVRGLTTAAALWCMAAIGLAVGFGMYVVGAAATICVLVALWVLDYVEDFVPKVHYRTITLRRRWEKGAVLSTINFLKVKGLHVVDADFERTADLHHVDIRLRIAFRKMRQFYDLERSTQSDPSLELLSARDG